MLNCYHFVQLCECYEDQARIFSTLSLVAPELTVPSCCHLLAVIVVLSFLECHSNELTAHSFCAKLSSLSVPLGFSRVAKCINVWFPLTMGWIPWHDYISLSIHMLANRHLACF